mmetsp:Transcript_89540/g.175255  ORF Transcript_89540/g.175255 Transcript_89540/m.175255 type:complete len:518 (+) Transcript_89540:268-1821(+)
MAANIPIAGAVPVAPFALAPALVGAAAGQPIDYSTRAGQALYKEAVAPLPYIFQGKDSSIITLLQSVRDRASSCGWNDIFIITIGQDADGNNIDKDLLTQFGEITLTNVRANATMDYIGMQVRNAQISAQIYQCLKASISSTVSERMTTEAPKFFFDDFPDGPSFLMTLIDIYLIQTKGTPNQIRLELAKAPSTIIEQNYDIDAFNVIINAYVQKLASGGNVSEDLFAHLTKAYKKVPDKAFAAYMRSKIDSHNDGTSVITSNELMAFAKTKYEELKSEGEWMLEDTEQKLVALTAQLEQINIRNKALAKRVADASKTKPKTHKPKPGNKPKRPNDGKWAWKSVHPKPGETSKRFEGKTYYWCRHHKKWTLHKTEDCRMANRVATHQPNQVDALQAVYEEADILFACQPLWACGTSRHTPVGADPNNLLCCTRPRDEALATMDIQSSQEDQVQVPLLPPLLHTIRQAQRLPSRRQGRPCWVESTTDDALRCYITCGSKPQRWQSSQHIATCTCLGLI